MKIGLLGLLFICKDVSMTRNKKIGRNDPCPCGSGLKYKQCCMNKNTAPNESLAEQYLRKYKIRLKSPKDIAGIRACGKLVMATFEEVKNILVPGTTTDEINTLVHEFTVKHGGIPAPLNYNGFPKSVCTSVNDVVCHGIPSDYVLKDGDIVDVDITTILNGYYADCNQTFCIGTPSDEALNLVNITRESLKRGKAMAKPGNHIGDIGWAIQHYAESQGCSVVRELVGHGVGLAFHEAPEVPHFGKRGYGVKIVPGMVFTIEPMINQGARHVRTLDDHWTVVTKDGSLSAQFEQTFVITEDGCESLTPFDL
jgi:methionyl aminopeptidase